MGYGLFCEVVLMIQFISQKTTRDRPVAEDTATHQATGKMGDDLACKQPANGPARPHCPDRPPLRSPGTTVTGRLLGLYFEHAIRSVYKIGAFWRFQARVKLWIIVLKRVLLSRQDEMAVVAVPLLGRQRKVGW